LCSSYVAYATHMPFREHGTFRLWPLLWSFIMDRAAADMASGVNRAYLGMRTCPGCITLTGDFNQYQPPASRLEMRRTLNAMLELDEDERQNYSFLCQGPNLFHGPLALAVVDPAVVRLDFRHIPADRWHGVINMVEGMTGCVRHHLRKNKLAEVSLPSTCAIWCDIWGVQ